MIPDDLTPVDDALLRTLLEEDDALLQGRPATKGQGDPGVRECLRMLEGLWPRGTPERPKAWTVGRFEVLQEVGRGGFGIVYRAHDTQLNRDVALKVPRPDVLFTPELQARFLREARAAGALDHPNIVPVYESGEDGPLCYIASAFCDGPTLSGWLRGGAGPVPARLAARLLQSLALAVQHAHDRGVLHRDIKPSNVLLNYDPGEDDPGAITARLTDFGLARIIEEAPEDSRSNAPLGSPPYMAPEQAGGRAAEVGPATDIHALGATLYEALTGRPPYRAETVAETLRIVRETDPIAPRDLRPGLPHDLETICLKCLEKLPRNRYASAEDLADDLGRFLDGQPIVARPPSAAGRLVRWARRSPTVAALSLVIAAMAAALVFGLVSVNVFLGRRNAELKRAVASAEASKSLARRHWFASQVRLAQQSSAGNPEVAQDLLESLRPEPEGTDLRGFAWHALRGLLQREVAALSGHYEWVSHVAVSPDGRGFASADADGKVILWDQADPHALRALDEPWRRVDSLAYSPNGEALIVSGTTRLETGAVRLFDRKGVELDHVGTPGAAPKAGFLGMSGPPRAYLADAALPQGRVASRSTSFVAVGDADRAVASPDGRRIAAVNAEGSLSLINVDAPPGTGVDAPPGTGAVLWRTKTGQAEGPIAFSPDGRRVAAADNAGTTRVYDSETGGLVSASNEPEIHPNFIAFHDEGRMAIEYDPEGRIALLDAETGARSLVRTPPLPDSWGVAAISANGQYLATGGRAGLPVSIWQVSPWKETARLRGRSSAPIDARSLAFAPDGKSLIIGCGDRRVRIWKFSRPRHPDPEGHPKEVWAAGFFNGGRSLATAGDDFVVRLWDVQTGEATGVLKGHSDLITSLAVDPRERYFVTGGFDCVVIVWKLPDAVPLLTLTGHEDKVRAVAISPDGKTIASAGSDLTTRLWDSATGQHLETIRGYSEPVRALAFSPDGKTLASAGNDNKVRLWDRASRLTLWELPTRDHVSALAFSPDGESLAAADEGGNVLLIDPKTATLRRPLRNDGRELRCIAFSPDGQVLAAAGAARVARLWDVATGQELLALGGHKMKINALAFDPNTHWLATGSHDGAVKLWDGRPGPGP